MMGAVAVLHPTHRPPGRHAETFTGTNPIFSGTLTIEAGTGEDRIQFLATGDRPVMNFLDPGEVIDASIFLDTNDDLNIAAANKLLLDATAVEFGPSVASLTLAVSAKVTLEAGTDADIIAGSSIILQPGGGSGEAVYLQNLPTSATGLGTGAIWNDAGTLKVVT